MHNILKIGQEPLSKPFVTSQQTFTCSKSKKKKEKNTRSQRSSNVVIVNSEDNSRHLMFLLRPKYTT